MRVETQHRTLSFFAARLCLAAMAVAAFSEAAVAAVPPVKYVEAVSANNSTSPKMAIAQCPSGWAVLGGTANVTGEQGRIAIQAAFPKFDAGLARYVFVVKATEDLPGTNTSWSVTAGAYCTDFTVPMYVTESSLFDSDSIKSATVTCPMDYKVVGMGAEVSTSDGDPASLVSTTPSLNLVFQGFETDADLTLVKARATEIDAPLGDFWAGNWKVSAVAACVSPFYFDGLELLVARVSGGGLREEEIESRVDAGCPVGKRVISIASTNYESDMGQWFLDRFGRFNLISERVVGEAYRNNGLTLTTQYLYAICTDK